MLLTLSPSLIATATAEDETSGAAQQVEQTGETKNTDPQPDQQPDQAKDGDKNEPQPTEEPKQDTAPVEEDGADADEPAPAPAVVPVVEQNVPVTSEIVYPTVNFTDVAPFLDPVSGSSMRRAVRNVATQDAKDDGISMSKTATANQDGSYTITLEAYATGSKVISEVTKDVPTDIILVLDQSGSMAEDIGTVSFQEYRNSSNIFGTTYHTRNQDYYEYRHNGGSGNLWHKLADGSYVSVSVTWEEDYGYTSIDNGKNNSTQSGATNYYNNRKNLYALVNGEYQKVTVERSGSGNNRTYTYTLPDGTQIASSRGNNTSPSFSNIDGTVLYLRGIVRTYTYTYTDSNNNVQTIGTSTGATTVFSPALYERITSTSGGGTRLDALKNAVNNFASAVHTKSLGKDGQAGGGDDINHRIALVGFSSPDYNNTELLTGSAINQGDWKGTNIGTGGWNGYYYFPTGYEMNGPQYGSISDAQYKAALLAMNTDAGLSGVASGVNALTAWGGTRTDNGLAMANKIFEQNPIPTGEQRNRVVIVFTDGIPGLSGYDGSVASSAITESNTAKTTYGATVYTIGIFSGADATSAGSTGYNSSDADKGNYFLQRVSSNTQYPQSPSYYLSAADSGSLNNIFQQISDQIETGGSSSTLTSDAVVKDIISPQFTLPEGATAANITLKTYACTGKDANGDYTWRDNNSTMGAKASINGDQVKVTGFNFSENYVGTVTENGNPSYRGNKLVISFKVQPKDGFLGGNDVYTNSSAGIYENNQANKPTKEFEKPTVNVPIDPVTVTAQDKNVYLKGEVNADQLKEDANVKVGDIALDLSEADYGLEAWQTEYVNIKVEITDKNGNAVADKIADLTEDTTYTVEVKVSPKTETPSATSSGQAAVARDGSGSANIYVFKPELTFKDSTAYYGDNAPAYSGNLTFTKWKHGNAYSTDQDVTMIGTAPELTIGYAPETGKIDANGKINTKQDIAVDVTVKIGSADVTNKTTFVHQACDPACSWNVTAPNGNPAFLIHVKTCQLTITKNGGAENEPYVFTVKKDGEKYTEVTIKGGKSETIYELPVGTYTIEENTGWSWRYPSPTYSTTTGVALSADSHEGTITCTNTLDNNKWLNGFSDVVTNISGVKHK